jgi:hypothetical protein
MFQVERDNVVALAIAKQIATFQGQIFFKLNDKQRASLMSLAHSILATVERCSDMLDMEITIHLAPRDDGGIRIWSDDVPGLILSGPDALTVISDIGPALKALLEFKRGRNVAR